MLEMSILLTGGAGFIGAATAERLLDRGEQVVVLDNFNDYYAVSLKRDRIARLARFGDALAVHELDFSDALQGGGFKVTNPNAATSCSCGESFSA